MTVNGTEPDVLALLADLLDPPQHPYLTDPVGWIEETTGEHLWSKQREIAEALVLHRRVAVKACHGPGKSHLASRLSSWWMSVHAVGTAFLASTAPTQPQVEAILWREIAKAHDLASSRGKSLPGKILGNCTWKVGQKLIGMGRKPANHDEHGFQGIHDDFVFLVIDEACGIVETLWVGSGNILTGDDARALALGNPDDPHSHFAKICKGAPEDGSSGLSDEGWYVITISVFDTPNFTGEEVPESLRKRLPGKAWLEEKRKEWGETSPLWISKVLGRFPLDNKDGVVPWSAIVACRATGHQEQLGSEGATELGIDVAGSEHGDATVIRERVGPRAGRRWSVQSSDPTVVAERALQAIIESGATRAKIDADGIGWGVMGQLQTWQTAGRHSCEIVGVKSAAKSSEPDVRANVRADLWWMGRELSLAAAWDLTDVDDRTLAELSTPKWWRDTSSGKTRIESKDDLRKANRLGRSPDDADALLLAFYQPVVVTQDHRAWSVRVR